MFERFTKLFRRAHIELNSCRYRKIDNPHLWEQLDLSISLKAPARTWDRDSSGAGEYHGK